MTSDQERFSFAPLLALDAYAGTAADELAALPFYYPKVSVVRVWVWLIVGGCVAVLCFCDCVAVLRCCCVARLNWRHCCLRCLLILNATTVIFRTRSDCGASPTTPWLSTQPSRRTMNVWQCGDDGCGLPRPGTQITHPPPSPASFMFAAEAKDGDDKVSPPSLGLLRFEVSFLDSQGMP